RFISKIEEVLNDWKLIGISSGKPLDKGIFTTGTWEEKSDEISFADFKFSVTHHYLVQEPSDKDGKEELGEDALPLPMQDLLCMNNDFPPRAHCLVRWYVYGLREFVVIAPAANNDAVISESKCNLLLSSISIALGNTGCQVPVFAQIHHKWRRMYVGECQGAGVRTDFEMVHLRKVPGHYTHLSGLLDIFKTKIGCPLTPLPPVSIAIRLTFVLQDWQQYFWPQQPPDIDALVGGEVGGLEFGKLPFGACEDPISELHLATTWPHLAEGIIVDNDVYSDLDPLQAPQWSVRVRKADNPQCLLGDFLTEFFKLCRRKESTDEILGRSAFDEEGKEVADISHALSKLTEPAPVPIPKLSVTNMVHSAKKKIRKHRGVDESPLNNDVLNTILLFLFPDAADKLADVFENRASTSAGNNPPPENEDYNLFSQFKSAPSDSLTYKLALCLCMINFYHGGVKGVAHLWQEFVLEMRYRWENNYLIPGLANGSPDLRCCLLHQKLQMLNCCIERKKARDEGKRGSMSDRSPGGASGDGAKGGDHSGDNPDKEKEFGKSWESWSDSEEEFFECLSDTEDLKGNGQENGKKGAKESVNLKPEGRLHPHGKLMLLHPGEPLYVPITQEPAPMTEDLLEEQSEVLAKLGTSAEGAHLRARMQSACLLSDMESFKVALRGLSWEITLLSSELNRPSGFSWTVLNVPKDFSSAKRFPISFELKIKTCWENSWHISESVRMLLYVWEVVLITKVLNFLMLQVLHYLAVQKPADLARHLLPCIIHAAVLKVKEEEALEDISSVKKIIKQIISHSSKVLRFPSPEDKKLEEIIAQIMSVEAIIARARSLKAKFGVEKCENEEEKEDLQSALLCVHIKPLDVFPISTLPVRTVSRMPALGGSPARHCRCALSQVPAVPPLEEELRRSGSQEERRQGVQSEFPPPTGREVILRASVPRPAPYSKALPQRMYSVLTREDFRLAGAFSADTTFF
ncbi:RB3GP protein, partial [Panurus biarmicus]|nr:RB3GP protein [Panurus biarmicus]